MYRSRSNPASPSSSPYSHPIDITQNVSLKRGLTVNSSTDFDPWRHGKRRRRDTLSISSAEKWSGHFQLDSPLAAAQQPNFATTSAQFNLFSRPGDSAGKTRRLKSKFETKIEHERQHSHLPDIVRLHSSAFWELRQSITDNGEGLVRRMREYERSRSRHHIHYKAKEAEKRGRKKLCPRKKKALMYTSDASEDEDILIYSAESANHIPRGTFFGKRAASLDDMDVDMHNSDRLTATPHARSRTLSSGSDTRYITSSPITLESDDDDSSPVMEGADIFPASPGGFPQESAPSLTYSPGESASSSLVSLHLSSSAISGPYPLGISPSKASINSDKALAALNLAFASGAGSISDYSSVRQYQEIFQDQSYDSGDLWH